MYCPRCGRENNTGGNFCGSCGAPIARQIQPDENAVFVAGAVAEEGRRAETAATYFGRNAFKLISISAILFVIVAFTSVLLGSLGQATTRLASLSALPAGLGTAAYLACAIAPVLLSLQVVLALVPTLQRTSDQVIRSAYFPAAAIVFVCIVVILGRFLFPDAGSDQMAAALSLAFGDFTSPAVIGVYTCVVAIVMIHVSNGKCRKEYGEVQ